MSSKRAATSAAVEPETVAGAIVRSFDGRVARIVLDRPEHGNRLTADLLGELVEVLDGLASERPLVIVLTGEGGDFCLGRDAGGDRDEAALETSMRLVLAVGERLRRAPSLVVASVQGRALGLGAGLVLHADLAVASEQATLGFDEVARGFPPTIVMTYLEDQLPRKLAREMVCAGRVLGAREAWRLGLVNEVVAERELATATDGLVARLLAGDERAVAWCKPLLAELEVLSPAERAARAVDSFLDFKRQAAGSVRPVYADRLGSGNER